MFFNLFLGIPIKYQNKNVFTAEQELHLIFFFRSPWGCVTTTSWPHQSQHRDIDTLLLIIVTANKRITIISKSRRV